LRFYGRFLFTPSGKSIAALAPHLDAGSGAHQPLMTIAHRDIDFGKVGDAARTTFDPAFRHVVDGAIPTQVPQNKSVSPEVLVWDVSGRVVRYQTSGAPTLANEPGAELLKLSQLIAPGRAPAVAAKALQPGSLTNAVVELSGGRAEAKALMQNGDVQFTDEDKARAHLEAQAALVAGPPLDIATDASGAKIKKVPADLVEVTVDVAAATPSLRLTCDDDGRDFVTVKDGAVVTFTNLCPNVQRPRRVDMEFSKYYDLLQNEPDKALVPMEPDGSLGEGMGCFNQAQVP
jgi:hypothetical protein